MIYVILKDTPVKVQGIGDMLIKLLQVDEEGTNVILDTQHCDGERDEVYVYHIDDGYCEKYCGDFLQAQTTVFTQEFHWEGKDLNRKVIDRVYYNHRATYNNVPEDNLSILPQRFVSILQSIITQPKLKAEDLVKELKFLNYDLIYKPVRLSASGGWVAKSTESEAIEPIANLFLDLLK